MTRMERHRGKTRTREVTAVSTTPIERTNGSSTDEEWRRLCHYYYDGEDISVCGTARPTVPESYHTEIECRQRRHTICVVCTEIWFSV